MGCGGSKEQDVQLAASPEAAPENVTLKEAAGGGRAPVAAPQGPLDSCKATSLFGTVVNMVLPVIHEEVSPSPAASIPRSARVPTHRPAGRPPQVCKKFFSEYGLNGTKEKEGMRFLKNEVKQETFDRSDPPILPFYSGEGGLLYVGAIQIVKADQLAKDATEWADFEWPPMFGVKVVFETAEEVPEDEQEALASAVMKSLASLADVAETSLGVTFGEKDVKVARTFSKDETKQVLLTEVVISVQDTEAETQLQEKLVDKLRNATALEGFLAGAGAKVQIEKDPTVTIVGMQRAFEDKKMFVLDLVNTEINIELGEGIEVEIPLPLGVKLEIGSGNNSGIKSGKLSIETGRLRVWVNLLEKKMKVAFMEPAAVHPQLHFNLDTWMLNFGRDSELFGIGQNAAQDDNFLDRVIEYVINSFGPMSMDDLEKYAVKKGTEDEAFWSTWVTDRLAGKSKGLFDTYVNNKLGKQFGGLIGKYTQRGCGKPLEFDLDVLGIIAGVVQTNL